MGFNFMDQTPCINLYNFWIRSCAEDLLRSNKLNTSWSAGLQIGMMSPAQLRRSATCYSHLFAQALVVIARR